ncbi:1,6-anhydro-N-acetylmuramyl-L-alanine amidase AmpD [Gallaecimonas xiamenensis]|uniref:1,6-anhydro-N-acetylmuramyl-L-alanine amidase AmpD n=1 Tax=Gallaecimonas xiamenensis 3-C-1 TaxID=745411 RepID=K2J891_9GAMM|nr:1,6-anhydro-N-acetylmuramyl-L-alanine amidase AmpD [Gallaecimonas xiamenensis]EKE71428.1 N-acetyl-anhydromuranmyl-L-alanine amidase [Gallaecimonas xiamenensis 3-C-1]
MAPDWYPGARRHPSPHFDERPSSDSPSLLVLHNISLPPQQFGQGLVPAFFDGSLDCHQHPWLQRLAGVRVSAHFFIERSGQVWQFVALSARAWHAGLSCFQGRERLNDFSLGVELEGADHLPFTAPQYQALAELSRWLFSVTEIGPDRVTAHETIAPSRKSDPGPLFDWLAYYRALESHP